MINKPAVDLVYRMYKSLLKQVIEHATHANFVYNLNTVDKAETIEEHVHVEVSGYFTNRVAFNVLIDSVEEIRQKYNECLANEDVALPMLFESVLYLKDLSNQHIRTLKFTELDGCIMEGKTALTLDTIHNLTSGSKYLREDSLKWRAEIDGETIMRDHPKLIPIIYLLDFFCHWKQFLDSSKKHLDIIRDRTEFSVYAFGKLSNADNEDLIKFWQTIKHVLPQMTISKLSWIEHEYIFLFHRARAPWPINAPERDHERKNFKTREELELFMRQYYQIFLVAINKTFGIKLDPEFLRSSHPLMECPKCHLNSYKFTHKDVEMQLPLRFKASTDYAECHLCERERKQRKPLEE